MTHIYSLRQCIQEAKILASNSDYGEHEGLFTAIHMYLKDLKEYKDKDVWKEIPND